MILRQLLVPNSLDFQWKKKEKKYQHENPFAYIVKCINSMMTTIDKTLYLFIFSFFDKKKKLLQLWSKMILLLHNNMLYSKRVIFIKLENRILLNGLQIVSKQRTYSVHSKYFCKRVSKTEKKDLEDFVLFFFFFSFFR